VQPGDVPAAGPARVILGAYHGVASPLPQLSSLTYLHVRLADGDVWTFGSPSTKAPSTSPTGLSPAASQSSIRRPTTTCCGTTRRAR
jgi:hypothetical protein